VIRVLEGEPAGLRVREIHIRRRKKRVFAQAGRVEETPAFTQAEKMGILHFESLRL
jgi:hypothetical protein